tara:strand:+ start:261 stop:572 length:312 start_codon:yes stop_codon:yes gene_type:complete
MEKTNKLIAEFMGSKHPKHEDMYRLPHEDVYWGELAYDYDWNWLMPVVHKCINIYHIEQMNDDLNFKFYDSMGDIETTYKAVVEFIKDYNNGKDQRIINNSKD